ncbi:MAG: ABC transporter permease [Candidatus Brocadiia bacterium]
MVGDVLTRKLLRDIRSHWAQFAAAAVVVLLGTGLFISFQVCYSSLSRTRDEYHADYNFAEFFMHLERAPDSALHEVESIPGVWRARGRIVEDVSLEVEGNEGAVIGRFISMPRERDGLINDIYMVTGSYFPGAASEEVIVNHAFAEANGLKVGDAFRATINERKEDLRIVGTARSPEYVYTVRNPTQFLPDDEHFGIIFASESFVEDAFDMTNAFNDLVGTLRPGARLESVLRKAEDVLERYGVFNSYGREDQLSNAFMNEELDGLRKTSYFVPLLFLVVAAVVVHVIVHRIVDMQRTQIGLLCALGYTKMQVVVHYVSYALGIGLAGAVPGTAMGLLLARYLMVIYNEWFQFPELRVRFGPWPVAVALLLSCGMCALGAARSSWQIMKLQPAVAIRPQPPQRGRIIHFGAFRFLWERLPLTWRISVRNTFRARARAMFSIFGVAVSMVMLVVGAQTYENFDWIMDYQFRKVDQADCRVDFAVERPPAAALEVAAMPEVDRVEGIFQFGAEIRNGWRAKDVAIMGLPHDSRLHRVYGEDGRPIQIPPDGLVVPRRLADELHLNRGDVLTLDPYVRDFGERSTRVRAVVDTYFGLNVYADRRYLCRLLGVGPTVTGVLVEARPGELSGLVSELDELPGVSAVTATHLMLERFRASVADMMTVAVVVQTVVAGIIAFSVIYNTASVSISEQERDLACLCSLGYDRNDVAHIATNDIMPLGLIGMVVGTPLAHLTTVGLARAFETDLYKLPVAVSPENYLRAGALVLIFLLIARWVSRRRIFRIDIVRRLKTME